MKILKNRGYVVPNFEIDLSLQQFLTNYGKKPNLEGRLISLPLAPLSLFCSSSLFVILPPLFCLVLLVLLNLIWQWVKREITKGWRKKGLAGEGEGEAHIGGDGIEAIEGVTLTMLDWRCR